MKRAKQIGTAMLIAGMVVVSACGIEVGNGQQTPAGNQTVVTGDTQTGMGSTMGNMSNVQSGVQGDVQSNVNDTQNTVNDISGSTTENPSGAAPEATAVPEGGTDAYYGELQTVINELIVVSKDRSEWKTIDDWVAFAVKNGTSYDSNICGIKYNSADAMDDGVYLITTYPENDGKIGTLDISYESISYDAAVKMRDNCKKAYQDEWVNDSELTLAVILDDEYSYRVTADVNNGSYVFSLFVDVYLDKTAGIGYLSVSIYQAVYAMVEPSEQGGNADVNQNENAGNTEQGETTENTTQENNREDTAVDIPGAVITEYDNEGPWSYRDYHVDGQLVRKDTLSSYRICGYDLYEYDGNGVMIKICTYDSDDTLEKETAYDQNGNQTELIEYSRTGKISLHMTLEYHDNGVCAKWTKYDANGLITEELLFYDNRQNKEIKYYENGVYVWSQLYNEDGTSAGTAGTPPSFGGGQG